MMWRYVAGAAAALLMVAAGLVLFNARARPDPVLPEQPLSVPAQAAAAGDDPLPDAAPEASQRAREEKRFDRYDKDRDGRITRDEYLLQRRKAYAKLDTNGDGRLSFDEWAAKTVTKFTGADADKSGSVTRTEFATTAPKRKARPRVNCPPATPAVRNDEG
ncbi:hypothetical protein FHS94_000589 [Sphingomonas aerophila]|uniref:EF-hand domain-containing protein n=2 Tax=Sphingomonas aerophila TaxID=1344948 RepID=A0A7W9ET36_9SPHN|nr:hypothetical protein [Sphingomonas aerophila]